MSCYANYRGRCVGRVLHFLNLYCNLMIAEEAQVGFDSKTEIGRITLHDEEFATYTWEKGLLKEANIPIFKFRDNRYNETQTQMREEILETELDDPIVPYSAIQYRIKKAEYAKLQYYLNLQYPVDIIKDEESGYVAKIPDLPGCITQGETLEETTKNLAEVKKLWLKTAIEHGDKIREPSLNVQTTRILVDS